MTYFALKKAMVKCRIEIGLKDIYAGLALAMAIVLSFIGTFIPPEGQIHDSMLYLIAQFLLLVATLMGVGYIYSKFSKKMDDVGRNVGKRVLSGRSCDVSRDTEGVYEDEEKEGTD